MSFKLTAGNNSFSLEPLDVEYLPFLSLPLNVLVMSLMMNNLVLGSYIAIRIFEISRSSKTTILNSMALVNNSINVLVIPLSILLHFISLYLSPLSDLIGQSGCIIFFNFALPFTFAFNQFFSVFVVTIRYLCIIREDLLARIGVQRLTNTVVVISVLVPLLVVIKFMIPVKVTYYPYALCTGQISLYFLTDQHYCNENTHWAKRMFCNGVMVPFVLFVIEGLLYKKIFKHISKSTDNVASLLSRENLNKRRRQGFQYIEIASTSSCYFFADKT